MAEGRGAQLAPDFQDGPRYEYWVAVSKAEPDAAGRKPDDAWFDRVGEKSESAGGGKLIRRARGDRPPGQSRNAGRQWTFKRDDSGTVRVVRVYVIKNRVYYLSAEGPELTATHEDYGKPFFETFFVKHW